MLLATVMAAVAGVWDQTIQARQAATRSAITVQIDSFGARVQHERKIVAALAAAGNGTRIGRLRRQRATALARRAAQQARLAQAMAGFVAPAQVGRLLADVLRRYPGLQLVKAESMVPEPLLAAADTRSGSGWEVRHNGVQAAGLSAVTPAVGPVLGPVGAPQLYRHGLALELSGSYLDAYAYLRELEALPWGLRWDRVSYEITERPIGRLVLHLHTLSKGPEWIGV